MALLDRQTCPHEDRSAGGTAMRAPVTRSLTRDFLTWVARAPRSHRDVLDTWQTSCPRLSIWEDALDDGLVVTERLDGQTRVALTACGRAALDA